MDKKEHSDTTSLSFENESDTKKTKLPENSDNLSEQKTTPNTTPSVDTSELNFDLSSHSEQNEAQGDIYEIEQPESPEDDFSFNLDAQGPTPLTNQEALAPALAPAFAPKSQADEQTEEQQPEGEEILNRAFQASNSLVHSTAGTVDTLSSTLSSNTINPVTKVNYNAQWTLVALALVIVAIGTVFFTITGENSNSTLDSKNTVSIEHMLKAQESLLEGKSEQLSSENKDEPTLRPIIPTGNWTGESTSATVTAITSALSRKDYLDISFSISSAITPKLTPEELVNNKKRDPWLVRFKSKSTQIDLPIVKKEKVLSPFSFQFQAPGKVYLRDDEGAGRLPTTIFVEGIMNSEKKEIRGTWKITNLRDKSLETTENFAKRISHTNFQFHFQGDFVTKLKPTQQ